MVHYSLLWGLSPVVTINSMYATRDRLGRNATGFCMGKHHPNARLRFTLWGTPTIGRFERFDTACLLLRGVSTSCGCWCYCPSSSYLTTG